jgi:betaine-aldehyde dehydrogenase
VDSGAEYGGYSNSTVIQSGLGRENGRAAIEHYTQLKSVYVAMEPIDAPY